MLRRCVTTVLILLVMPFAALAQNTGKLSGVITDVSTGESLPGANIILGGTLLGSASDLDGNYFIIGVPVGAYDITASFVGYQSQTVQQVEINAGYTRELNFSLMPGAELEELLIVYERPILQKDAIGAPRVMTSDQLVVLPIRGVANVASLQSGVVSSEGTGLFVRGSREQELTYYVDGVRISGQQALPRVAISEQEMLIGTIPAKYGDAQAGVVSVTTKSGADRFFGTVGAYTSQGLDSYGHSLGEISLGGPIIPGRLSFFVSGQHVRQEDSSPYGVPTYQLTDEQISALNANPQVVRATNAAGDSLYLPFPWEAAQAAFDNEEPLTPDSLATILGIPEGYNLGGGVINAPDTYRREDFTLEPAKDSPFGETTVTGNVTIRPTQTITLRVGGAYETRKTESIGYSRHVFNPNSFYHRENDTWRVYGSLRQRFASNFFYQIDASYQDYKYKLYPDGFAGNIEETFSYGDLDSDHLETVSRYFAERSSGYAPRYTADGTAGGGRAVGITFTLPGSPLSTFQKQDRKALQVSGNATAQIGLHQLEFGGEYRTLTQRFYSIGGFGLSRYAQDDNCEQVACYDNYSQLPFDAFRPRTTYYGYDFRGLNEVDDQDIQGYFDRTNLNVAPYQPIYYGGYLQDKIEYRDLILNLGVRMEVFDNNAPVLKDIYAPRPIVRAGSVSGTPAGIDPGDAVYFNDAGDVVGYRDLDGNFFGAEGSQVDALDIVSDLSGQVQPADEPISNAFEDYTPQATFMPRIGVSFPVTDRAVFFASYNITSQRPTENAFTTFRSYEEITSQNSRTSNPKLEPERTTQYELGFRQRLGASTALTISGFYRTQENKISNRRLIGGFPSYGTYLNADFTTTKGVEFSFDLRRTRNLALTANYTLSFAQGTGSDAGATSVIVWRGSVFPNTIAPADFDQRHTLNASLDYRFGEDEGPMIGGNRLLENMGLNILLRYGSGMAYTALAGSSFNVSDSFTDDAVGSINSARLPSTSRIDLRLDRRFQVGGASLTAYLIVLNLLDTQNVLAVFRATGLPNTDGYLMTDGGRGYLSTQPDPASAGFLYNTYIGGPVNVGSRHTSASGLMYSRPRLMRLGFMLNF
jgi:outer membrane receptor protein involved in Fe transport